jgi:hypothetical protein
VRKHTDRSLQRVDRAGNVLLERLLDNPRLAQVVPRLTPEVLHKVIETCGLEDCGALVALTTPEQLQQVFDLDLWRAARPGLDEQFDPDRFALWLEVLIESGADAAAQKLAGVEAEVVVAALAQHVRVMDCAATAGYTTLDGQEMPAVGQTAGALVSEIGGYRIEAKRTAAWDAIVDLLLCLDEQHPEFFHRVMAGCRRLSNDRPEQDGFHDLLFDPEQDLFDLAVDREQRRERRGYVTPAQARAFLQGAREQQSGAAPQPSPIARAYFRAIEPPEESDASPSAAPPDEADQEASRAVAEIVDVLREAGVLDSQPRGLLGGSHDEVPRPARLEAQMQFALEREPAVYSTRSGELAYLANTILTGCSIQARPFTLREASDAAAAVCNLGLENWPDCGDGFLLDHDLVSVFQVGWRVLYADVCMFVAEHLIDILGGFRCRDRQTQAGLDDLRFDLSRHWRAGTPWRASDALDVVATLDLPAWAALLGLVAECPVVHAALTASVRGTRLLSIDPTAFEFISDNRQIGEVRTFVEALPGMLRG